MKLGSLFDGSGGFPLAGSLCGIVPTWAAEVEPYPIAVTRSRFPNMKHLGSVTDIHGGEIEPVDIITFGSPCQDLSVAGKRAGLKHEANGDDETTRSGLFMEAVRIIKEMREATNGMYPTFALWENVPGAFSSNKGEDFRTVLAELINIVEPGAVMPPVPKAGWAYADSYTGDGWSLAYRVFNAQHWGVPQRRRRIHLVVDFRGERAREILFEREGVRGYFTQGRTPWQGSAADPQGSPASDDREGGSTGGRGAGEARDCGVGRGLDAVTFEPGIAQREGGHAYEGVSGTLRANAGDNQMAVEYTMQAFGEYKDCGVASGLKARDYKDATDLVCNSVAVRTMQNTGQGWWNESPIAQTLRTPCGGDSTKANLVVTKAVHYIVRRLTPTECARLQGFADRHGNIDEKADFTDEEYSFWLNVRNTHAAINGKQVKEYTKAQMLTWYNKLHTDGAEYKMWGNGIALPPALYCMQGMAEILKNREE